MFLKLSGYFVPQIKESSTRKECREDRGESSCSIELDGWVLLSIYI